MKCILMSRDPIAIDTVACKLMNLDPNLVPTISLGGKLGFGQCDFNKIEVVGDNLDFFCKNDFSIDREPLKPFISKGLLKWIKNWLAPKPIINKDKCIKCGICIDICPTTPKGVGYLKSKENIPQYNYDNCIRCFCCQEMCPQSAVSLKKSLARKMLRI